MRLPRFDKDFEVTMYDIAHYLSFRILNRCRFFIALFLHNRIMYYWRTDMAGHIDCFYSSSNQKTIHGLYELNKSRWQRQQNMWLQMNIWTWLYIWTAEKDMKIWLIIAVIHTSLAVLKSIPEIKFTWPFNVLNWTLILAGHSRQILAGFISTITKILNSTAIVCHLGDPFSVVFPRKKIVNYSHVTYFIRVYWSNNIKVVERLVRLPVLQRLNQILAE